MSNGKENGIYKIETTNISVDIFWTWYVDYWK